ncbi:MAG: AMP-binding protein [Rubrivivax sp.]|nr:AMP-binding protein [Rubrivivax sp.]
MAELTDTLDAELARRAAGAGDALAYLQKRHGIWQRLCWRDAEARVGEMAAGLRAAGLQPGEAVGVVSGARVEAVLAVLACQRARLVPVLLNPALPPGGVANQAQQAGVVAFVAEDQEQVDKIADMQTRLDGLRAVWVIDPKGTRGYQHLRVRPLSTLDATPALAPEAAATPPPAVVLFSAGVFGEPRCVPVSQATLRRQVAARAPLGLRDGERCVSLFGLADPIGHFHAVVAPVLLGTVACFGEDRLPGVPEMRQCAPQVVAIPARLLDRLRRETAARASRAGGWRRALIQRWSARERPGALLRTLVGRPVADALGLGACRAVLTGYERMAPASARFLARLGIDTRGLYALAEAAGPVAVFAQAAEPALKVFEPYAPAIGADGRLVVTVDGTAVATGDLVHLQGGELHLVGRAADLLTLPDGTHLAPATVEAELMTSPYINQAVAVGGPATGVTALVELDEVTLRDWARGHGLAYTTLRSYAESTEVRRLVDAAVAEANQRLPQAARIVRAVLLPRALEAANGELTPALALRRAIVRNRYAQRLLAGAGGATP